ncbi:MAG: TIGR03826 family flagellar region protein [Bacillota bacterium]|nr:TIGR03826 family flagellar region protein [Bacillota bacterium]
MSASLRNCPECGRLFAYTGRNLCPRCMEKEEEDYMVVRRYIRDHRGASIFEVSEETGIEEDKILRFLKEGRLESRGFKNVVQCERCGKSINQGRYCESCLQEMSKQFQGVAQKKQGTSRKQAMEKMYTKEK